MDRLRWMFELMDRMSGPGQRIASSLGDVEKRLAGAGKGSRGLGDAAGFASDKFMKWGAGLGGWLSLAEAAKDVIFGIAQATVDGAMAFGSFGIKMLSFKESTLTSFELMTGTKEAAKDIYDQAVQFGRLTPFETEDVVAGFKQLMAAGFNKEDVGTIFAGLGDVAAASGFDKSVIQGMAIQMAQVKAYGKLQMVDLRVMANQMAQAGVGLGAVFEKIGKNLGVSTAKVQDLMGKGLVNADVGILSIMQAIQDRASKGNLGDLMMRQSTTVSGLLSTLRSAAGDFFLTWDKGLESPGMAAFKGLLVNLVSIFDTTTATGQRFQLVITNAFNALLAPLSQFSGPGGMEMLVRIFEGAVAIGSNLIGMFVTVASTLWDVVSPMFSLFGAMGTGSAAFEGWGYVLKAVAAVLGVLIDGIIILGTALGYILFVVGRFGQFLFDIFKSLADFIIQGLLAGLTLQGGLVWQAMTDLAGGIKGAFTGALGIKSPSRIFQQYGRYTAQGYTKGLEGSLAGVDASVGTLAGTATGAAETPAGGSRSAGPMSVSITVQVDNSGHQDGDAIAARLAELLPSQVAGLFDQLAMEAGA